MTRSSLSNDTSKPARERVLDAAERLFMERGYTAVMLRDIAEDLDIKIASLYYHAPGGKEELFVQVVEQAMERHRDALEDIFEAKDEALADQLRTAVRWMLSQPPMNVLGMLRGDLEAIDPDEAVRLRRMIYESALQPLVRRLERAQGEGTIRPFSPNLVAGAFFSALDGVQYAVQYGRTSRHAEDVADEVVDMLLHGLLAESS